MSVDRSGVIHHEVALRFLNLFRKTESLFRFLLLKQITSEDCSAAKNMPWMH